MEAEISQAKREDKFYLKRVDQAHAIKQMEIRRVRHPHLFRNGCSFVLIVCQDLLLYVASIHIVSINIISICVPIQLLLHTTSHTCQYCPKLIILLLRDFCATE